MWNVEDLMDWEIEIWSEEFTPPYKILVYTKNKSSKIKFKAFIRFTLHSWLLRQLSKIDKTLICHYY